MKKKKFSCLTCNTGYNLYIKNSSYIYCNSTTTTTTTTITSTNCYKDCETCLTNSSTSK